MERYFADRIDRSGALFDPDRYPMHGDDLIAEFEGLEIQYPNGEDGKRAESIEELLDRTGTAVYDTPEDLRLALFGAVSAEAVGRRYYSDRDPPVLGTEQLPTESF